MKGRYMMKFLLVVLAIHFLAEVINNKLRTGKENKVATNKTNQVQKGGNKLSP